MGPTKFHLSSKWLVWHHFSWLPKTSILRKVHLGASNSCMHCGRCCWNTLKSKEQKWRFYATLLDLKLFKRWLSTPRKGPPIKTRSCGIKIKVGHETNLVDFIVVLLRTAVFYCYFLYLCSGTCHKFVHVVEKMRLQLYFLQYSQYGFSAVCVV